MPRTSTGSSSLPDDVAPPAPPSGHGAVRARLKGLGLRPAKGWGQSFLTDPFVADMEAALLESSPGEPIVEIGGGLGLLTEALVRRGFGPITVLERDPRLADHLRCLRWPGVTVRTADALRADFDGVSTVIGNLPFSVAAPILSRLFEARVHRIVVLLQREVGERYTAPPGGRRYGRPAIQAALYGTAEPFAPVPRSAFEPTPRVDGIVVRFLGRDGPLPVPSVERFEREVRHLFSARRKQLINLLPGLAGGEEAARELARGADWPVGWERMRPEALAPEQFFALSRARAQGPSRALPASRPPSRERRLRNETSPGRFI
ncbi:MAG: ribosomal RNA small subunit methyltransferase A [Thermoplasmata archaeon]